MHIFYSPDERRKHFEYCLEIFLETIKKPSEFSLGNSDISIHRSAGKITLPGDEKDRPNLPENNIQ